MKWPINMKDPHITNSQGNQSKTITISHIGMTKSSSLILSVISLNVREIGKPKHH